MSGMEIPLMIKVAAAITATAATVSAVGTIQQGREQQRQANFAAQQAEIEAQEQTYAGNVAATNAAQAQQDAQLTWDEARRQKDRVLGTQRSLVAKSGLTLTGSAAYVQEDTALNFQREANRALFSGLNESGNYRYESRARRLSSQNALSTASNYRASGRAAVRNSYWSAGGTLLGGIGQAGYMYATRPSFNPYAGGSF